MLTDELKRLRYGRFTASESYKLFTKGTGATRATYIRQVAESKLLGWKQELTSSHTEHGNLNEWEAIETFAAMTGLDVRYQGDTFMPYGDDAGATPDALIFDISDRCVATMDAKCPTKKFFEQRVMVVKESKPEYQNSPASMYWQGQMQMLAASSHFGYEVNQHYLVRYLTSGIIDDDGNKIEFDLTESQRMYWKLIEANKEDQARLIEAIKEAAIERDRVINEELLIPIK